jgi:ABC-type cobalamin/Fe3+-siderophores transport system ATPase subunit
MSLAGHNLTIGYSDRVVGRGLNVALKQGEVLALLGPNGGGKTTLLKPCSAFSHPAPERWRSADACSLAFPSGNVRG